MKQYLAIYFFNLLVVIWLTPKLIIYLRSIEILDFPGGRKNHEMAIPNMGGIIILVLILISSVNYFPIDAKMALFISSVFVLAICGIADDILNINYTKKFILQSVSIILLLLFISGSFNSSSLFFVHLTYPFDFILLFVFCLGVINAINFMDGLDGLVSGFGVLCFFCLFLLGLEANKILVLVISAASLGALSGFLKYNTFPAKIFLGDTGSYIIAFFLLVCGLLFGIHPEKNMLDLTPILILLGVPVIDAIRVITMRLVKRKNVFLADNFHLHFLLIGKNIKHKSVVFVLHIFSLLFIITAIVYSQYSNVWGTVLFFVLAVTLLLFPKLISISGIFSGMVLFRQKTEQVYKIISPKLKQVFLLLSLFISFLVVVLTFSYRIHFDLRIVNLLLVFEVLLGVLALYRYHSTKILHGLYLFLNLVIFFEITNYSLPAISAWLPQSVNYFQIVNIAIILLVLMIGYFYIFRTQISKPQVTFFTGLDLVIFSIILISLIGQYLMRNSIITISGRNFFISFLFYLLYKIYDRLDFRFSSILFFSPFIINIIILGHAYF
jgi:UDP-GlcNAc:undecaprenyl-phosphate/decaprenyl-phosphate GlcNAc-1-phosphate transferase